ncbi:MAG: amino acid adenylation domain-containing protein, partial [bacterium]|nr:amino acid adenylation domain-containing protein [bacterium]
ARLGAYLRLGRPRGWLEVAGAEPPPSEVLARVDELAPCRLCLPPRRVAAARDLLGDHAPDPPGVSVGADDLAYVAFTSGSTGEPKGILGRRGSLTHFLPWLAARFGFDGEDRHSLLSALSHDPLHRDVFMPLWYGATVCIPDPERIGTPGYLARWVGENRLTVLNAAPAMLQLVCQRPPDGKPVLSSLRWAFVIGDVLTRGDVEALYALAPAVRCVNYYGSTETQRAVSYFVVEREPPADGRGRAVVPVGRGIQDVQLLILNPAGGLAGVGELGEIHFRSHHLARGYLGDEALTRERFLTNPFTGVAGDRLYRTGDLGRYRPDGTVEFLGRVDHQVKIRGFRVELGEIEALVGAHPAVRECAIGVRDSGPGGDRRLVAWVTSTAERPDPRPLR